jgi:hypothetical chaperone protein
MSACCAIDFGTSNSAVTLPRGTDDDVTLVALEDGEHSMPTAVFYCTGDDPGDRPAGVQPADRSLAGAAALPRAYGRAALAAYVDGHRGRLMRSMKSSLGSSLVEHATDLGNGDSVRLLDVVIVYLRHLRALAERAAAQPLDRAVVGRPVFFVDDDPPRDARAQAALEKAAHAAGFAEVRFQYEPIAAALDYERRAAREQVVLVADIGGGTSDFSVVRVGPRRTTRADRRDDILANHGVRVAGTDFDRHLSLSCVMPLLGLGSRGPAKAHGRPPREVPSAVYFDLATWHLVNSVYAPRRVAELRATAPLYAQPRLHARLMRVVGERLGHHLLAACEAAKIETADGGAARLDLQRIEPALDAALTEAQAAQALHADLARIEAAALEAVRRARLKASAIEALYFTGGSTGLGALTARLAARFPGAEPVHGDRLSSVARGLGVYAARAFAAA